MGNFLRVYQYFHYSLQQKTGKADKSFSPVFSFIMKKLPQAADQPPSALSTFPKGKLACSPCFSQIQQPLIGGTSEF